MQWKGEIAALDPSQESKRKRPGSSKTFKSVTTSAKSFPPAGQRSNDASDSNKIYTDAHDANSDGVTSDMDGNPACTTRSVAHGAKQ